MILKLMTLSNSVRPIDLLFSFGQVFIVSSVCFQVVRTTGLKVLNGLFLSMAEPQGLTEQLNAQLISVWFLPLHSLVPRPHPRGGKRSDDFGSSPWSCAEEFPCTNQISALV